MALFDLFKKKEQFDEQIVLNELKAFSKQAIEVAKPEIAKTGSFLPFGVVLTTDDVFEMVVYVNAFRTFLTSGLSDFRTF